jgi:hypothetical protein
VRGAILIGGFGATAVRACILENPGIIADSHPARNVGRSRNVRRVSTSCRVLIWNGVRRNQREKRRREAAECRNPIYKPARQTFSGHDTSSFFARRCRGHERH